MKVYACFLLFTIFAHTFAQNNPTGNERSVNLALETVLEFSNKDNGADIKFLDNIQNFITRVKSFIDKNQQTRRDFSRTSDVDTFTDFIQQVIGIVNSYEDSAFQDFFDILDEEIRKYHYRGCKFYELTDKYEIRQLITEKLDMIRRKPVFIIKAYINVLADILRDGIYEENVKDFVDYVNSLYRRNGKEKFEKALNDLESYGKAKSKRTYQDLVKIIKDTIRATIFDHYTDLNLNARRELKDKIDTFLRQYRKPSSRGDAGNVIPILNPKQDRDKVKGRQNAIPDVRKAKAIRKDLPANVNLNEEFYREPHVKNHIMDTKKIDNKKVTNMRDGKRDSNETQPKFTDDERSPETIREKYKKLHKHKKGGDNENDYEGVTGETGEKNSIEFDLEQQRERNTQRYVTLYEEPITLKSTKPAEKHKKFVQRSDKKQKSRIQTLWVEEVTGRLPKAVLDRLSTTKKPRHHHNKTFHSKKTKHVSRHGSTRDRKQKNYNNTKEKTFETKQKRHDSNEELNLTTKQKRHDSNEDLKTITQKTHDSNDDLKITKQKKHDLDDDSKTIKQKQHDSNEDLRTKQKTHDPNDDLKTIKQKKHDSAEDLNLSIKQKRHDPKEDSNLTTKEKKHHSKDDLNMKTKQKKHDSRDDSNLTKHRHKQKHNYVTKESKHKKKKYLKHMKANVSRLMQKKSKAEVFALDEGSRVTNMELFEYKKRMAPARIDITQETLPIPTTTPPVTTESPTVPAVPRRPAIFKNTSRMLRPIIPPRIAAKRLPASLPPRSSATWTTARSPSDTGRRQDTLLPKRNKNYKKSVAIRYRNSEAGSIENHEDTDSFRLKSQRKSGSNDTFPVKLDKNVFKKIEELEKAINEVKNKIDVDITETTQVTEEYKENSRIDIAKWFNITPKNALKVSPKDTVTRHDKNTITVDNKPKYKTELKNVKTNGNFKEEKVDNKDPKTEIHLANYLDNINRIRNVTKEAENVKLANEEYSDDVKDKKDSEKHSDDVSLWKPELEFNEKTKSFQKINRNETNDTTDEVSTDEMASKVDFYLPVTMKAVTLRSVNNDKMDRVVTKSDTKNTTQVNNMNTNVSKDINKTKVATPTVVNATVPKESAQKLNQFRKELNELLPTIFINNSTNYPFTDPFQAIDEKLDLMLY